ncbi:MAG: glycosyltransferase family 4 protein [Bacteroidia bacterium]
MNRVPWPLKDGGSIGYYNFTKGYHDAGCEVTVAALNTSKHFVHMNYLPEDFKELADWRTCFIDNRVKPFDAFVNLFSNGSYNISRFISKEFELLLEKILKEKKFDVVVFESLFVAPYLDLVRKNTEALLVLRQHNVEHRIWSALAEEENNPLRKWYIELLAKRLEKFEISQLNKFDALTTVTENDAEDFKKMGCTKRIFISPTGMDISKLKPDHSKVEWNSIFHLGSMEWMPNQQAILWFIKNVWNKISEKNPDLKFYIAGRGMPDSFLKLNEKNIVVSGEVEDALKFIQSKNVMIVPLFSGSGIRIKILEAMALGKPVISTSLGVQGIEGMDGKHFIIADNEKEFMEAIEKLSSNTEFAKELGANARRLIEEKYENKKIIERLLDFYKTQIENRKN